MSADNGIYILETRDSHRVEIYTNMFGDDVHCEVNTFGEGVVAWRVAHAQAIDNLDWYENNQAYMVGKYLHDVWGKSKVFYDYDEAHAEAVRKEAEDVAWTEYGICLIRRPEYSMT